MAARNRGLHRHRFRDNPEEKRFADAWEKQHAYGALIEYLLSEKNQHEDVSDRDRLVAATVVQWLGSPVGQGFLSDLGYVRRKDGE